MLVIACGNGFMCNHPRRARVPVVLQTDGGTPLYVASQNGHVEVVRALVGAGAAVNQAWVRDDCCGWCSFDLD